MSSAEAPQAAASPPPLSTHASEQPPSPTAPSASIVTERGDADGHSAKKTAPPPTMQDPPPSALGEPKAAKEERRCPSVHFAAGPPTQVDWLAPSDRPEVGAHRSGSPSSGQLPLYRTRRRQQIASLLAAPLLDAVTPGGEATVEAPSVAAATAGPEAQGEKAAAPAAGGDGASKEPGAPKEAHHKGPESAAAVAATTSSPPRRRRVVLQRLATTALAPRTLADATDDDAAADEVNDVHLRLYHDGLDSMGFREAVFVATKKLVLDKSGQGLTFKPEVTKIAQELKRFETFDQFIADKMQWKKMKKNAFDKKKEQLLKERHEELTLVPTLDKTSAKLVAQMAKSGQYRNPVDGWDERFAEYAAAKAQYPTSSPHAPTMSGNTLRAKTPTRSAAADAKTSASSAVFEKLYEDATVRKAAQVILAQAHIDYETRALHTPMTNASHHGTAVDHQQLSALVPPTSSVLRAADYALHDAALAAAERLHGGPVASSWYDDHAVGSGDGGGSDGRGSLFQSEQRRLRDEQAKFERQQQHAAALLLRGREYDIKREALAAAQAATAAATCTFHPQTNKKSRQLLRQWASRVTSQGDSAHAAAAAEEASSRIAAAEGGGDTADVSYGHLSDHPWAMGSEKRFLRRGEGGSGGQKGVASSSSVGGSARRSPRPLSRNGSEAAAVAPHSNTPQLRLSGLRGGSGALLRGPAAPSGRKATAVDVEVFAARMERQRADRAMRLEELRQQHIAEELSDCTFRPQLVSSDYFAGQQSGALVLQERELTSPPSAASYRPTHQQPIGPSPVPYLDTPPYLTTGAEQEEGNEDRRRRRALHSRVAAHGEKPPAHHPSTGPAMVVGGDLDTLEAEVRRVIKSWQTI